MNRNTSNRWNQAPMSMWHERSKFDMSTKRLFTGSNGSLIPFYWEEVVPGDTIELDTSMVVRMTTPLFPVLDNLDLDYYYFYIPKRLVWDHFPNMLGDASGLTGFENPTEYETPQISAPTGGWRAKTIADYMGIPTGVDGISIDATLFRSYAKVWNDWFRSEYLQDERMVHTDDTNRTGSNGTGAGETYIDWAELGGPLLPVGKQRDYFVSVLPKPQVGQPILIPASIEDVAPVFAGYERNQYGKQYISKNINDYSEAAQAAMRVGASLERFSAGQIMFGKQAETDLGATPPVTNIWDNTTLTAAKAAVLKGNGSTAKLQIKSADDSATLATTYWTPINLFADTANLNLNATINDLRTAFAIQRLMERMRRGGQRFNEIILANFAVNTGDARIQRSEYLGGNRVPIQVREVIQHSATQSGGTPLGETGAVSKTAFVNRNVVHKSFVEHGWIIGVLCTRIHRRTYQNGISRKLLRLTKWDQYWPGMQFLSEQSVMNQEIFAQGTSKDKETFGFQERYGEMKSNPNMVMGEMRSNYTGSLDAWHYADDYSTLPTLSGDWIQEGRSEVDRTLAVNSNTADQFYFDVWLPVKMTRCMAQYGIPGMIDHF